MSLMKEILKSVGMILTLITALSFVSVCYAQEAGNTEGGMGDLLSEFLSNPAGALVVVIQFGLGLGLGYFSMKALKYIVALIAIVVVGVLLNIWQFGGLGGFVEKTGLDPSKVHSIFKTVAGALGILTVVPVGIGFFIGIIVAMRK